MWVREDSYSSCRPMWEERSYIVPRIHSSFSGQSIPLFLCALVPNYTSMYCVCIYVEST